MARAASITERKHTPGPWIVVAGPDPVNKTIIAVNAAGQPAIATTRSESFADGCKPDEENAYLIAAAPALLAALSALLTSYSDIYGHHTKAELDAARAAIASATQAAA
jgi:hypothetical protein